MPLTDLDELLEPWLDLPIKGTVYRIPAADAETGLWCQRFAEIAAVMRAGGEVSEEDAAALKLDDDEELSLAQRMLTLEVYQQMLDDGVPWEHLKFASRVVYVWTTENRQAAETLWESGGRPESRQPAETSAPDATTIAEAK